MADIKIKINNYKLLENFEQEYKDCRVLLVTADNEKGKSSLIRGIIENMTAKSVTDDPVTHGKMEGNKTFTIPDKDGNQCVIHHEFSEKDKKGSFYAIDHKGKKISSVNKIRELVGTFEELSIETFYNMQKTAEGRRKIIKNYFYPLLMPEQIERINEIDEQTSKGGSLFNERAEVNSLIKYLESQLEANKLSEKDIILANEHDSIVEEISNTEKTLNEYQKARLFSDSIKEKIYEVEENLNNIPIEIEYFLSEFKNKTDKNNKEIEELKLKIQALEKDNNEMAIHKGQKLSQIGEREKELTTKLKNLKEESSKEVDVSYIFETEKTLNELRTYRDKSLQAINNLEIYNKSFNDIQQKCEHQSHLQKKIDQMRKEKLDILSNSKLPAGLVIDGDEFTWNGFSFNDAQISKSSAMLVIAEILCNVIGAKIVYIGEKALFNEERFKQLVKIAEKYGKIPVLEQVIDKQNEIKVITEINE